MKRARRIAAQLDWAASLAITAGWASTWIASAAGWHYHVWPWMLILMLWCACIGYLTGLEITSLLKGRP